MDRSGLRLVEPLIEWTGAQVCAQRGELAAARAHADPAGVADPALTLMHLPGVLARMHVAAAEDDLEGVITLGRPLLTRLDEPTPDLGLLPWPDPYTDALITLGRLDEATDVLDRWKPQLLGFGSRSAAARVLALRARVLAGTGAVDQADAAFTEATDLAQALGRPLLVAGTSEAHGRALRRAGRRREAEPRLRRAQEVYQALGAVPALARVERELRAGRLQSVPVGQAAGAPIATELTAQEQAVAELVVSGLINKEVATQLFVSPKTVQYHLTRVYQKLQVRGRAELASRLR
ncbi:helix-turn-helix transcriptional regulator [Arsenicicoccus piscis]|uniref:HTH luxR-type domain-containing protein n=1 Tax=Arsenicicoccus piscis TaxID=673954 RepID=A0ABQ6HNL8_9MICO|nr:helix-turn-helix transcriptional regulator [Arsenicicoccus piscis]MCH8629291.1 helix-turn-helix transcriptional regulator [Arsenicicoccus piscis]GMA19747.1 hypothetical protein GCM10025862_17680 [Arsenicicoccus piscis]GMA22043.1 hypothetical protein GCM10025862_40640 [Arsenicicoccus piscis]